MIRFPIILLLFAILNCNCAPDCIYSRDLKPCQSSGGRVHLRDVKCSNGKPIHVCCKLPYRKEVQHDRQHHFRLVTKIAHRISPPCTQRILCEQSCKDWLNGLVIASYPEALPGDDKYNHYIQAFKKGEVQACSDVNYNELSCEKDCKNKYPKCEQNMKESKITRLFYRYARLFHLMGMLEFSAEWMVRDMFSLFHKNATTNDM